MATIINIFFENKATAAFCKSKNIFLRMQSKTLRRNQNPKPVVSSQLYLLEGIVTKMGNRLPKPKKKKKI